MVNFVEAELADPRRLSPCERIEPGPKNHELPNAMRIGFYELIFYEACPKRQEEAVLEHDPRPAVRVSLDHGETLDIQQRLRVDVVQQGGLGVESQMGRARRSDLKCSVTRSSFDHGFSREVMTITLFGSHST